MVKSPPKDIPTTNQESTTYDSSVLKATKPPNTDVKVQPPPRINDFSWLD